MLVRNRNSALHCAEAVEDGSSLWKEKEKPESSIYGAIAQRRDRKELQLSRLRAGWKARTAR